MNKLTELRARAQTLFFPPQGQRDEGAGIVEYAAILVLVAAIAIAIFALDVPSMIRGSIDRSITEITRVDPPEAPEST